MNFASPAKAGTTAQWRTERICQFTPNFRAVEKLLSFVGFSKVTFIEPTAKGLQERYLQGTRRGLRVTFLAEK